MKYFESLLRSGLLITLIAPLLASPWVFGAWPAWWFWPFVTSLALAASFLGALLILKAAWRPVRSVRRASTRLSGEATRRTQERTILVAAYGLFLLFALGRAMTTPVPASAQRSFLLFLTPFVIALTLLLGLRDAHRRVVFRLIVLNSAMLGLYGLINHAWTGSSRVMWATAYPQYLAEGRASGSFYCPDHFAGMMELGLAAGLALLALGKPLQRLAGGSLCSVAVAAIILSRSRGAGLTLGVMLLAWLWFGGRVMAKRPRYVFRMVGLACAAAGLLMLLTVPNSYSKRFGLWFGWHQARTRPWSEKVDVIQSHVTGTARWQMWSAAAEAWRTSPWIGVGAGMHQHLWPRYAASNDGDRSSGRWPARLNNRNYSYETHNDWLQLLEEYGLLGFVLFLAPCLLIGRRLAGSLRPAAGTPGPPIAVLAGLLAGLAMAFHSLGDFNLQIPAITWNLAALVTIGLGDAIRREPAEGQAP